MIYHITWILKSTGTVLILPISKSSTFVFKLFKLFGTLNILLMSGWWVGGWWVGGQWSVVLIKPIYYTSFLQFAIQINRTVTGTISATLLKKRIQHRCFPVSFAKIRRTNFLQKTYWRQLVGVVALEQVLKLEPKIPSWSRIHYRILK